MGPSQLDNLFERYSYQPSEPIMDLGTVSCFESRLDALLLVPRNCKAQNCIKTQRVLHPARNPNPSERSLT